MAQSIVGQTVEMLRAGNGWIYCLNDYMYTINQKVAATDTIYLRCREDHCSGTLQTNLRYVVKGGNESHYHNNNRAAIRLLRFKNIVRERCLSGETTPLRTIYEEVLSVTPDEDVRTLPFEKFRRTMQVWRDSVSPPIPESLAHWAHLLEDEVYRHRGAALPENEDESNQRPLYRGLIGGHSILFVSDALKRVLQEDGVILGLDGTFKATPNIPLAKQVLTIVAILNRKSVSVAWAVMTRKKKQCYVDVLERLKEIVPYIIPRLVLCDFESALQRAIRTAFPNVRIVGCWVHYMRALRKKRLEFGLTDAIINGATHLRNAYFMALSLPLLPATDMEVGINIIEQVSENNSRFATFLQYIRSYWLRKREILSVYKLLYRTNNHIEAHNKYILRHMGSVYPNAWMFMAGLQKLEKGYRVGYLQTSEGTGQGWPQSWKHVQHDRQLRQYMNSLQSGNVQSIRQFLERVKHHTMERGEPNEPQEGQPQPQPHSNNQDVSSDSSSSSSSDDDNDDNNNEIGEPQLAMEANTSNDDEVREFEEPQMEEEVFEIDIAYLDSDDTATDDDDDDDDDETTVQNMGTHNGGRISHSGRRPRGGNQGMRSRSRRDRGSRRRGGHRRQGDTAENSRETRGGSRGTRGQHRGTRGGSRVQTRGTRGRGRGNYIDPTPLSSQAALSTSTLSRVAESLTSSRPSTQPSSSLLTHPPPENSSPRASSHSSFNSPCVSCLMNNREYLMRPCLHYGICDYCLQHLRPSGPEPIPGSWIAFPRPPVFPCPICRQTVTKVEKIFIA